MSLQSYINALRPVEWHVEAVLRVMFGSDQMWLSCAETSSGGACPQGRACRVGVTRISSSSADSAKLDLKCTGCSSGCLQEGACCANNGRRFVQDVAWG